MKWWRETNPAPWKMVFGLTLLVGIAIRLAVITGPGTADVQWFRGWSIAAADLGAMQVYPPFPPEIAPYLGGYKLPVNYPPITAYYLGAVGKIYLHLPDAMQTEGVHNALVKLPAVLFELLAAVLICRHIGRKGDRRRGALAFAAYWLNPAIIIAGAFLGYQDAIAVTLSFLSLLLALESRVVLACVAFVLALLVKQLALFVFPVLAVFLLRSTARWKAFAGFAALPATACLVLLPFILAGRVGDLYHHLSDASVHAALSANALNVWWIFTSVVQALDQLKEGVPILQQIMDIKVSYMSSSNMTIHSIGRSCYVLFTLVNLFFLYRRSNSRNAYLFAAAMQYYGYFMLMTGVHENHLLYAPVFLAVLMFESRELKWLYFSVSFMVFINLFWFYGVTGDAFPRQFAVFSLFSVAFSVANFIVFLWACVVLVRGSCVPGDEKDRLPLVTNPLIKFLPGGL